MGWCGVCVVCGRCVLFCVEYTVMPCGRLEPVVRDVDERAGVTDIWTAAPAECVGELLVDLKSGDFSSLSGSLSLSGSVSSVSVGTLGKDVGVDVAMFFSSTSKAAAVLGESVCAQPHLAQKRAM